MAEPRAKNGVVIVPNLCAKHIMRSVQKLSKKRRLNLLTTRWRCKKNCAGNLKLMSENTRA